MRVVAIHWARNEQTPSSVDAQSCPIAIAFLHKMVPDPSLVGVWSCARIPTSNMGSKTIGQRITNGRNEQKCWDSMKKLARYQNTKDKQYLTEQAALIHA